MKMTAEEIIESLMKQTGLKRSPDKTTSNVLSKQEMKELLVFIVHIKGVNVTLEQEVTSLKKQNAELVLKTNTA